MPVGPPACDSARSSGLSKHASRDVKGGGVEEAASPRWRQVVRKEVRKVPTSAPLGLVGDPGQRLGGRSRQEAALGRGGWGDGI